MSLKDEYRALMNEYLPRPIRNEAGYRRAVRQIEKLMTPNATAAKGMLIEVLATLIEQYESRELPTPEVSPIAMLAHCLESKEQSAAQVARSTGIPQATLSNVLAGRRGISKVNAAKLASYFNLPVGAFLEPASG